MSHRGVSTETSQRHRPGRDRPEIGPDPGCRSSEVVRFNPASQGYCLYLENGRPTFAVTAGKKARAVAAGDAVVGRWTDVTARIAADGKLILQVNGREVARSGQPAMIESDPRDTMQIGADRGSKVVEGKDIPDFTGDIERIPIYSGELP